MTISPPAEQLGTLPRVRNAPASTSSSGSDAVELAALAGLDLDPWQRTVLEDMLGERADGRWSAFEAGMLIPRQNGKGAVLEARELAGLFLFGEQLIIHSAHEFKTAVEAFRRLRALLDVLDPPDGSGKRKRVKAVTTAAGNEGVELFTGQRVKFLARSRLSGRGFSGDTVILDEAQELSTAAIEAILPTLSARPNPQVIYAGTVPTPENDAEHWTSLRDRGRAGGDPSLAWLEWSPGEDWDDLDDLDAWARSNPALGYRLTEEAIARERATFTADGFARERLSIWPSLGSGGVIPLATWAALEDRDSTADDPVVFAADVTPDRDQASVSVAGRRPDGLTHVELLDARPGVGWVVPRLLELIERWRPASTVLDGAGPAASLITELQTRGVEPLVTGPRDMARACGAFYDAAVNDRLRHTGRPELADALGGAKTRPLGDAWAWSRRFGTNTDITPLVAVTLAFHGIGVEGAKPVAAAPKIRFVGR